MIWPLVLVSLSAVVAAIGEPRPLALAAGLAGAATAAFDLHGHRHG